MSRKSFITLIALTLSGLTIFISCNNKSPKPQQAKRKIAKKSVQHLQWVKPNASAKLRSGDEITIKWQWKDIKEADSVVWFADKQRVSIIKNESEHIIPDGLATGKQSFVLKSYKNGKNSTAHLTVEILSDIEPQKSKAKIIRKLHHDPKAFTQGLEIHNGFIYESTGQYQESSMRKVDMETGKVINIINLKDDVFGEGMTIFKDKIYQLTWQSNTGYVYDLKSFKQMYEFVYPTEGWGLTNDGENLIMSDGSQYIYFIDPEYFTEVRKISVYNYKNLVTRLNELEYINGKIVANILGEDNIVIIDPKTGKILHDIDMSNLRKAAKLQPGADVLNGIAWNKKSQTLYATGKYWPAMFEVKIKGLK